MVNLYGWTICSTGVLRTANKSTSRARWQRASSCTEDRVQPSETRARGLARLGLRKAPKLIYTLHCAPAGREDLLGIWNVTEWAEVAERIPGSG